MPISSFPQEQSLFERLGTGFGGGLSQQLGSGLQALGQAKINQMLQQQKAAQIVPGLKALFPQYGPEALQGLSNLDPKALRELIKLSQAQMAEAPLAGATEAIESGDVNAILQALSPKAPQDQDTVSEAPTEEKAAEKIKPTVQPPKEAPKLESTPGLKADQELKDMEKLLSVSNLTAGQKQQIRDRVGKRVDKLRLDQEKINKKFDDFVQEGIDEGKGADITMRALNEMETLTLSGKLTPPILAAGIDALNKIPWIKPDLWFLTSKETQKFRKIQRDFVTAAKKIFGARVTEGEVRLMLERFPSLLQSEAGKFEVIDYLKPAVAAQSAKKQAIEEIEEQYGGNRPPNFKTLVNKRTDELKDQYAKEFKKNLKERRDVLKAFPHKGISGLGFLG